LLRPEEKRRKKEGVKGNKKKDYGRRGKERRRTKQGGED
jgi:hypothetical protein